MASDNVFVCGCGAVREVTKATAWRYRTRGVPPCAACSRRLRRRPDGTPLPPPIAAADLTVDPRLPTKAQPGSPLKVAILEARFALWLAGEWEGPVCVAGDRGTPAGYSLTARRADSEANAGAKEEVAA